MPTSKSRIGRQILAGLGLCAAGILSQASAAGLSRDDARECYLATLKDASRETDQAGLRACGAALEAADDSDARAGLLANRAYIRLRMTDYAGTVADADASLSLAPDLAAANLNRGAGLIGMGRYQDALPPLEKAVALSSGDKLELAYYNRGIVREHLGDISGAYFDYKKAAELDPKFAPAQEQLARFTVAIGPAPDVR
ncbi:MAG TPA: tetratricopeptide repeat protein [Rhizomicrobium sp.]|jgi:tetratricopeptide (TPR) repeat protein|nr:tetratricopeptide repeat protein [Rhizomicrobium sp.]